MELTIRVDVPEEIIQTWDVDKIRRFVYAQADEAIGNALGMAIPPVKKSAN